MPEYTPELRAEVDAAMAAATEGEWHRTSFSSVVGCVITSQPDPKRNTVTLAGVHGAFGDDYRGEVIANANAIVALHNAYPALTAHIDAQAKRIAELREALQVIVDDYQTSPKHHPNDILIPIASFGLACAALTGAA